MKSAIDYTSIDHFTAAKYEVYYVCALVKCRDELMAEASVVCCI